MTFSLNKLSHLLQETELIDFALLLGSAQDGVVQEGSDIDLALMFSSHISVDFEVMARIYGIVDLVAPGIDCDLIRLNTASETVRFEALKGRLLFVAENRMEAYADFYSLTCRQYEDTRAWSAKQVKYRRQRPIGRLGC